jgi:excisionase family DNA binding protein
MHEPPGKVKMRARVHVDALLLRREEAARVLGVSARTLDRWVKDGLVKRLTIGSIGLFAIEDLRAFVGKLRDDQSGE